MANYLIPFAILLTAQFIYFRIAERYNITDQPNSRSSHNQPTIRGGGIIFPLAGLLWFLFYGLTQPWMILGLMLVAAVSFIDDMKTLPVRWRMLTQIAAVSLLFLQLEILNLPWYVIIPVYFFTLGWINAFNFMDGINAITSFYSFITIVTFFYINTTKPYVSFQLLVLLLLAVMIFGIFNARRHAKTFAGDVGSVGMAYLLGFIMAKLILETGRFEYTLFFAVYLLDTIMTILYRVVLRENILLAHRFHLYQLLSNELGWPHTLVAALYALAQICLNILVIFLINSHSMNLSAFLLIAAVLLLLYLVMRTLVRKKIKFLSIQTEI